MRSLHAAFAAGAATIFSGTLRSVSVSLVSLGEESSRSVTAPDEKCGVVQFSASHAAAGYLYCSDGLVRSVVSALLGCDDMPEHATGRALSEIERQLWADSVGMLLTEYAKAWKTPTPLHLQAATVESVVEPPPDESLYIARYDVHTPQRVEHFTIALRLATWREMLHAITPQSDAAQPNTAMHPEMLRVIGECELPVRVLLGTSRITVRDILSLRTGDIICLDQHADDPLEARVGAQSKLTGQVRVAQDRFVYTIRGSLPCGGE